MDFEVLVDCDLIDLVELDDDSLAQKKKVLSIVNDFEDGKWRFLKFQNYIWDNISQTTLSARERVSLGNNHSTVLHEAAKKLRLTDKAGDPGKGSELAEIILYGIMKDRYGALPVVPKIFYKQNSNDYAKGADSVHIVVDGDDFTLWFGEAKFYTDIEDARLAAIIQSVENSLDTGKLKKENSIISNVSDIDELDLDPDLASKIKSALSNKNSIDSIKPKLNIPILLLHQCATTKAEKSLTQPYRDSITTYHTDRAIAYFSKQIGSLKDKIHLYSSISFHIILFPVPEKKKIVDKFIKKATFHREEE
ncbi:hypothetical protein HNP29_001634 [Pseudomonas alcaligenes]|nr:hypothetical protein [Pseudomonas alcaligenes]